MRIMACRCSSVRWWSAKMCRDRSVSPSGFSRIPACTYRVSAEMRNALAICWRISADGRLSPRSIWLRYGLEIRPTRTADAGRGGPNSAVRG